MRIKCQSTTEKMRNETITKFVQEYYKLIAIGKINWTSRNQRRRGEESLPRSKKRRKWVYGIKNIKGKKLLETLHYMSLSLKKQDHLESKSTLRK